MFQVISEIVSVDTKTIKPYHRNVRHNDVTVEKLVEVIPKVGFNVPLVLDRNNVIVKGHTRWKAAIKLGMKQIPCVYTDADEETIKLDRLADNRVSEFSQWDDELLKSELASLNLGFDFDLGGLNFKIEDVAPIETAAPAPAEMDADAGKPAPADRDYHEVTCNKCGNTMFVEIPGKPKKK